MAAPAPPGSAAVDPAPSAAPDACFSAARDLKADLAACDVLINGSDADVHTLAATHNNRGLVLESMGMYEEALADFDAALKLEPDLAPARVNRANALFALARYSEALAGYDDALATMTTNRHVALFNKALTLRALGNVEQAAAALDSARRSSPAR